MQRSLKLFVLRVKILDNTHVLTALTTYFVLTIHDFENLKHHWIIFLDWDSHHRHCDERTQHFPPTKFKPTVTAGIYICPQEISSHFLEWTNVDGISFPSMSFFTFGFFGHAVICFKTLSDQSAIIKQGDCFCHPKDL